MKRTSHSKFSVRFWGNSASLVVLFLLCAFVLVWRSFFTGLLWQAAGPLSVVRSVVAAPFEFMATAFSSKAALEAQNAQLTEALASTTARVADRDALYQETLDLKTRLLRDAKIHTTLAGVLIAPPGVPYDTLLVDAGSAQGVSVGDLVSAGGTTLVGRVAEVRPHTASVVLYSAPGERYDALLLLGATTASSTTAKSIPITLEGQGSGSLRAEVPAGTPVHPGASVVTPGVVHGFSGTVSVVDKKDSESFETVYVTLPVNPQELRFVEVWKQE